MALQKKSATMHGVTRDQSGSETVQLGPAVYSELEFEGCRVKALIDTGSLATIVSLNCLLDSLAKGSMRDQTPAEWEAAVKRRLKPPEITLRSYGGGGLDLVGQLLATLQSGPYRQTAVDLVQNGAPEDFLLGTDLQPHLGFQLSQKSTEGPAVELVPLPERNDCTETDRGEQRSPPVVRLLKAERLPAHHGHVVRARVDPPIRDKGHLFVPLWDHSWNRAGKPRRGWLR